MAESSGPDPAVLAAWGLALIGGLACLCLLILVGLRHRDIGRVRQEVHDMRQDRDRFLRAMEQDDAFRHRIEDMLRRIEAKLP